MKRCTVLLFFVTAIAFYPSCKKNDPVNRPNIVDTVKIFGVDSTQLIKGLFIKDLDSLGNYIDSTKIYLYYDTLNRKVFFASQPITAPNLASSLFEQSYNNDGLVIQQKANPLMLQDTTQAATVDFTYDAQNVLSSQTTTYFGGATERYYLTKAALPSGGYSLSTKSSSTDFVYDSTLNTYIFDATGKLIVSSELDLPSPNGGYIDSVVYDAAGNISKVMQTSLQNQQSTTYTLFEFNSRDTKGNQFSNFNNILFNGIAKFPSTSTIDLGGFFNGFENYYYYQFTMYPSLSTKVYQLFNNSFVTFNPDTQYDGTNRLVKYKMYNGDSPYYYEEYNISYYK